MYLGSHSINLDAKFRIAIPSRIRETLMATCGGRIVLTANPSERCVWIYPEEEWLKVLPQVEGLPTFNKHAQRVKRLMIGYAAELEMDSGGRVVVSQTLREYAGLDKKVMLIGQGSKLELWGEDRWNALLDEEVGDEELPSEILMLSL